ncbi:hypothetical protein NM688_g7967 [Phlebia brevispora]|uniref:Uncharacterized protein n=1 Tax=Phlebia brevispora TaxID=194682 RepID=A0ACC1RZK6_9APHY|nr:hypothetical protein NM688_g7967 [Phlebia brevispora]
MATSTSTSQRTILKAQQWANGCVFQHSGGTLGPFGENLAAGTGSSYDIAAAVKSWTDEVSQYDPNNPQPSHFTQVVWKATTQVGCAEAQCSGIFPASFGLAKYFVCEYSPQGNVIGEFPQNVQRPFPPFATQMLSRGASTASAIAYIVLVLITTFFIGLSCALLLSQAVRTAPNRNWFRNFNAAVIGAAYALVLVAALAICLKRRIAVHRKLQRISKSYRTLSRSDVPKPVYRHMQQEYARACLIAYESQPKNGHQEGWGAPGSKYSGVRYRTALLQTIREIDKAAHVVLPRHPTLRPHARMLHHFRFLLPLLPRDQDGLSPLHYYDSAIQLARHASREPTEAEFILGITAASQIKKVLDECRLEALEGSTLHLPDPIHSKTK